MFVLPDDLPLELTPFAFLVGTWQGVGVISDQHRSNKNQDSDEPAAEIEFGQRVTFSHSRQNFLTYSASSWLLDEAQTPLPSETGFWRLVRPVEDSDHGPGLLPGRGEPTIKTRDDLEKLRNKAGGFNISASILHPSGISEFYTGQIKGARVDLQTTQGLLPANLSEWNPIGYGERMFGQVEGALLWVWEVRPAGQRGANLVPMASARLERVE